MFNWGCRLRFFDEEKGCLSLTLPPAIEPWMLLCGESLGICPHIRSNYEGRINEVGLTYPSSLQEVVGASKTGHTVPLTKWSHGS